MSDTLLHGWQHFIRRFPHSRLLWNTPNGIQGYLRAYSLYGRIVIIHEYANYNGWTAYVDPFTTLDTQQTFNAIARHCGDK